MKFKFGGFYGLVAVAGFILLVSCGGGSSITSTTAKDPGPTQAAVSQRVDEASDFLTDIIFQGSAGREEVVLAFSATPKDMDLSQPSDNIVALTLKDTVMGEGTRERYTPERLSKIKSVSLRPVSANDQPSLGVTIELSDIVPYRIRRSGSTFIISFDTAAIQTGLASPVAIRDHDTLDAYLAQEAMKLQEAESGDDYRGERLSIVCQDAHIKNVFRLISEVSGYSIVAGPEVDQKVTLHMRNVPWDQALETILEVNELGMSTRGRVITVMPRKKMEEAEEQRLAKNVAEGRVRQVSIEAQIVEVSTTFSREIGVRWGVGFEDRWSRRDIGMLFGSSAPSDDTTTTRLPGGIGLTGSNIAVNFPSGVMAAAPALGIVAGSSRFVLNAKIQALETTGDGKIISSPKVTTVDNVEATISQGEQIPFITRDEAGNPQVDFKDADLSLTVTPRITADGKISMTIMAENNYADWPKAEALNLPGPPLVTSRVESNVVVNDGDTIIIGGIYKSTESSGGTGIPWLSGIPILGWLFKDRSIMQEQRELLIFITPVILDERLLRR